MEEISNEYLKISINEVGASLTSILSLKRNKELLYQIEEGSWAFQDVVLFPLIGKGEYEFNNTYYSFPLRHGLVRDKKFRVIDKSSIVVTLRYESVTEDLAFYPFKFTFDITYMLLKNKIVVRTKIYNDNDDVQENPLYYSYGSHTGIKASSSLGSILLSNTENKEIVFYPLDKNGLIDFDHSVNFLELNDNNPNISLNKELFKKYDTLVFKNNSDEVILDSGFNYKVKYSFNAPLYAIWSNKDKGEFVCIEPWWGISNYVNESSSITDRLFINKTFNTNEYCYSLEFVFND